MPGAAGTGTPRRGLKVGLVTTEPSGDRLGVSLISALREQAPDVELFGMPGPRMRAAGCEVIAPMESVAVMGFVEVLRRYRELSRLRADLMHAIAARKPDVVVGIDAPDFNIGALKRLAATGCRRVQLVSPQVWAWRRGRVKTVATSCDMLLSILPFEAELYEGLPLAVHFIGHPVADEFPIESVRGQMRVALALDFPSDARLLAVLPGSRRQEIAHLAEPFFRAAAIMCERDPRLRVLCPCVSAEHRALLEQVRAEVAPRLDVRFFEQQGREVLQAADVALVASGTATLESLLAKTPMVVGYRMPTLNHVLARRLVRVPFIAMPNLLAGRRLVPEFIQHDVTPEHLADAAIAWLCDDDARADFTGTAVAIHREIRLDASRTAARHILYDLGDTSGVMHV